MAGVYALCAAYAVYCLVTNPAGPITTPDSIRYLDMWPNYPMGYQLFLRLTGADGRWLGLLFFVNFFPMLIFTPIAGVVADRRALTPSEAGELVGLVVSVEIVNVLYAPDAVLSDRGLSVGNSSTAGAPANCSFQ